MHPDDERLGRLTRRIRRRSGMSQELLAVRAGVPVDDLRAIEHGLVGHVRVDRVRAVFEALDGRLYLKPWWHGAHADRLIDDEHAAIAEQAAGLFARRNWRNAMEVTFAEYRESGSIDLLAGHDEERAVAVCEIKSTFGSLEETNRTLDAKARLAPRICERVFGWRPSHIGRLLIVPDDATVRRIVARHRATMDSIYPARSREVRSWLRRPSRSISAIWFLSFPANGGNASPEEP
jgi:hypothetical protein